MLCMTTLLEQFITNYRLYIIACLFIVLVSNIACCNTNYVAMRMTFPFQCKKKKVWHTAFALRNIITIILPSVVDFSDYIEQILQIQTCLQFHLFKWKKRCTVLKGPYSLLLLSTSLLIGCCQSVMSFLPAIRAMTRSGATFNSEREWCFRTQSSGTVSVWHSKRGREKAVSQKHFEWSTNA